MGFSRPKMPAMPDPAETARRQREEEEKRAAEKAVQEWRARMNVAQGRRANRLSSDVRSLLNKANLLG